MTRTNVQCGAAAAVALMIAAVFGAVTLAAQANPLVLNLERDIGGVQVKVIGDFLPWGLQDDPGKAKVIPPAPKTLSWIVDSGLEYAIEPTHIRFDHSPGHFSDAMNVRWNYKVDLFHEGGGGGDEGEYWPIDPHDIMGNVKPPAPPAEQHPGRNDPVVYSKGSTVTVQVRFRIHDGKKLTINDPDPAIADGVESAYIKATVINASALPGQPYFMELQERVVWFHQGIARNAPDPTSSHWVTFNLINPIGYDGTPSQSRDFHKYEFRYEFKIKDIIDNGTLQTQQGAWYDFHETERIHVYTVVGTPSNPWFLLSDPDLMDGIDPGVSHPWVFAICFAGYSFDAFQALPGVANYAEKVTTGAFSSAFGLSYDHEHGAPRTIANVDIGGTTYNGFDLMRYMRKEGGNHDGKTNCSDQAAALYSLVNLAYGGRAEYRHLGANPWVPQAGYGYVPIITFVGGGRGNNPFYMNRIVYPPDSGTWIFKYENIIEVDTDHIMVPVSGSGSAPPYKRSLFGYHTWVRVNQGTGGSPEYRVYDATVGPAANQPSMGLEESTYLASAGRDRTTEPERKLPPWMGSTPFGGVSDVVNITTIRLAETTFTPPPSPPPP
jgi:hypothetical protein